MGTFCSETFELFILITYCGQNQRLKKLEDEETAIKMAEEAAKWDAAGSLAQMGSQVRCLYPLC